MSTTYISCADTAKLIRQALKEAFHGVKFSVKSSTYSGGASISIRWTDGPSSAMVDAVAGTFQGAYFDGMTDYKGSTFAMIDGKQVKFGADYIHTNRDNSDAAIERAIAQTRRYWGEEKTTAATVAAYKSGELYRVDVKGWGDMHGTLQSQIAQALHKHSFYLAPKKSKTAGRVIYLGNDGYSQVGALSVEG
jgi:hypothetical protein